MRSCAWLVVWGGAHGGHGDRGLDDVHQFGGQGPSVKHSRHYHGASGVPSEVLVADPMRENNKIASGMVNNSILFC